MPTLTAEQSYSFISEGRTEITLVVGAGSMASVSTRRADGSASQQKYYDSTTITSIYPADAVIIAAEMGSISYTVTNKSAFYDLDPTTGAVTGLVGPDGSKTAIAGALSTLYALQAKATAEQSASIASSQSGYEDTAASIFTEPWASASANWTQGANPCQVSGNALFANAAPGGGSGQNHSYQLSGSQNLRAVFLMNMPAGNGSGGIIIGVSKDAAGVAPSAGGANAFGLYFANGTGVVAKSMDSGAATDLTGQNLVTSGTYVVTVAVDQIYISVTACKTDGTNEIYTRRLRSGFAVNNLYVFNSDNRALSGMSVGVCSSRKGLQTITPRTFTEGTAKTIQWSGDGTNSWMVFLPAGYDSRKPLPVVMCFHGSGTNETSWISNSNYSLLQRAFVNAGYIVVSVSLNSSQTTWGNTSSTDAYYAAYKYLRDNYAVGPLALFANSMGGIESLNALAANKIPGVVAWVGTSVATNLAENYANAMFTSAIDGAYSISGGNYATQTAGKDPNLLSEHSFRQLPMLFITATDDASVTPSANALTFAPKMNAVCPLVTSTLTTGGHSFSISPFLAQITAFFDAYSKSA